MRALIVLEYVFIRTPDQRIWSSGVFTTGFFRRYLEVFAQVLIAARVRDADVPGSHLVEHPAIRFAALPFYQGLGGFLARRRAIDRGLRDALACSDAVILRVPSPLAGRLEARLSAQGRPFAVEVVGDPWDSFAPGAIRHPLRPLLRRFLSAQLRRQCRAACASAYVTAHALQRRYPPAASRSGASSASFTFSSIELNDEAFAASARKPPQAPHPVRLISVGTMSQRYKGHDVLIDAVAACRDHGFPVLLELLGDGMERADLERQAARLGLSDAIRFAGHVSDPAAVRAQLDGADAFVLASRQEGLPRAMIEAMARALPCLGTKVGGIPELLPDDDLVPPDDAAALSALIMRRMSDHAWLIRSSSRNLDIAARYRDSILRARRNDFYRATAEATAAWQAK